MFWHIQVLLWRIEPYLRVRNVQNSVQSLRIHMYSEPWHSQNSLFDHFQRYLGIFRDIDAYSATLTTHKCATKGRDGGRPLLRGRPLLLFLKIAKRVTIFERKALIASIFGINFPSKMQF